MKLAKTLLCLLCASAVTRAAAGICPRSFEERETTNEPQPVLGTPNTVTLDQRADILMARKMYREAIDIYSREPESLATRWNKIGIAYHQLQDLPAAKNNYNRALKANPNYGEAINNLGTIYYAQKHLSKAIHQYRKALKVMPQSASILSNLGTAYFAKKDYKHATDSYQSALRLDPDVFEHHDSFGVMLEEHTVTERAKLHYYLAKMYAEQNRFDRALLYMRKSIEEGFTDRNKFRDEPEFTALRDTVEFQELMKSSPRIL